MTIWVQRFSNERSHNARLTVVLTQESQCHDASEDQRRLSDAELVTMFNVYCYLQKFTLWKLLIIKLCYFEKKPSSAHYQQIFEDNDEL